MRRHRKTLIVVAALLALGWLAWNVLLVESDVAEVAEETPSTAPAAP
jgi:hypothetical protein